ncbi:MAG: hypothetical protein N2490_08470 [Ignavibacteria bacterium]|nr:hypothetical protein [Ignavibacteria bacterium]
MIIYIHGFRSSGKARKAQETKEYFKYTKVVTPDLPVSPKMAFFRLCDIVRDAGGKTNLIGSSLGGFYAMLLNAKYGLKAVLINPAIKPYEVLEPYVGELTNYHTGEKFEWRKEHIIELKELNEKFFKYVNQKKLFLLLARDDELLNHEETKFTFPNASKIIEYDKAGHEFSRYKEALPEIKKFFESPPKK